MYERRLHTITRMEPQYVKVPNTAVAMDARAVPACYPQGSFYQMISGHV